MSIAEFFESGEMKEHQGAFRNLVMIARADGIISDTERSILERMGTYLDITQEQINEIMENPNEFPVYPPYSSRDRRERMVDLVRMAIADGEFDSKEIHVLSSCAIGLGYSEKDIPSMVNRIRFYLNKGYDRDAVIEAMLTED
ncbi:MAG: TerB family tellurite resistance protein [Flavobacteriales bacterium]|nr:TerB family tellurite resistance protein [Flavobacteriales bacterium]